MQTVEQLVKARRQELDITAVALGRALGVSGEFVAMAEKEVRYFPLKHIPNIALSLRLDPLQLIIAWLAHHEPRIAAIVWPNLDLSTPDPDPPRPIKESGKGLIVPRDKVRFR